MEHNTDRILWTVLILAIGVALYVVFNPAANHLLGQGIEKIQTVATNVNSDTVDSNSDFSYSAPNKADNTISIVGYSGSKENLTIPQHHKIGLVSYKVTSIGDSAFNENTSIKHVTIPDSVTSIGNHAFERTKLTTVNIPDSVTSIGGSAFDDTPLTSVNLPANLISIGDSAFSNTDLTTVNIPANLTSIGDYAFWNTKLTSVDLPSGLKSIGGSAFERTKLTTVNIPDSVTSIGYSAFQNTPISAISFKKPVDLGNNVFAQTKLTNVTLPTGSTWQGYPLDANAIQNVFGSGVTVTFK